MLMEAVELFFLMERFKTIKMNPFMVKSTALA